MARQQAAGKKIDSATEEKVCDELDAPDDLTPKKFRWDSAF